MSHRIQYIAAILGFLFLALLHTTAGATTIRSFSLAELCDSAPDIVVAVCVDVVTERDPANGLVYTLTTFRIQETWKGAAGATLTVRLPGGTLGDEKTVIPGMPVFRPGEESVLFLTERDIRGYPWVMGLGQGDYRISADPVTGDSMVRTRIGNVQILDTATGRSVPKSGIVPRTLTSFKETVTRLLGRPAPVREAVQ